MGLLRRCGKACTRRSTFLVQPRDEHRRREVKPLQVPTKEYHVKQCAQGQRRGTCWALPCRSSKQGARGARGICHQLHPCAICLAQRQPWASSAAKKATAAECPHGQDLATSHKTLWNRWKEKQKEEKGDYSTSSLLPWAPTLCWLPALRKWHRRLAGALATVQPVLYIQPSASTSPIPRENLGELRTGTSGKRGLPGHQHRQRRCPSPAVPQDFAGDPIHHSYAGPASLHRPFPAAAQKLRTKLRSKSCSRWFTKHSSSRKLSRQWTCMHFQQSEWLLQPAWNLRHFHISSCSEFIHLYKFLWG